MGLMYLLAAHLLQCWSSVCLHPGSGLLLLGFYIASLWLRQFLWVGCRQVVFTLSFVCVWSQRPWQSRQIILLPIGFLHVHLLEFYGCDVMDRSLQKPFWFFLSIFSILGSMGLRSRALYYLAAMYVRAIPW